MSAKVAVVRRPSYERGRLLDAVDGSLELISGLGTADPGAIKIAGMPLAEARVIRFRKASLPVGLLKRRLPASLYAYLQGQLVLSPEVVPAACTGCGECFDACRSGAVRLSQSPVGRALASLFLR